MEENGPLIQHDWCLYQRRLSREFPGGPCLRLQPPSAEGLGSIPGQGTRIPHAATKGPICHNYHLAQTKCISKLFFFKDSWIHTHIQHHVKMKAETGVMYLQPKQCQEWPAKHHKLRQWPGTGLFLMSVGRNKSCNTSVLNFQPANCETIHVCVV